MPYKLKDLDLSPNDTKDDKKDMIPSGHVVYRAKIRASGQRVIYKENKHKQSLNSQFEVAFTALAECFLGFGLTAPQHIVNDDQRIVGVASENLAYSVFKQEATKADFSSQTFMNWTGQSDNPFTPIQCETADELIEQKGITFFDQHDAGLLSTLYKLRKEKKVTFNMNSLANVLTGSFTLEEDDLHKGNFGFYLRDNHGVPEVNFIKIDHDLMLVDSVMSHGNARFANLWYTDYAFDISLRDLLKFPLIKDSGNHYWPARFAFLSDFQHKKAYTRTEVSAIAKLSLDHEFIRAKWRSFYKHILISETQIRQAAATGFDESSPEGKAYIDLVTNAVVARQARLRAALFAIPQFRKFVTELAPAQREDLFKEASGQADVELMRAVDNFNRQICEPNKCFIEGDTPLHVAIRLGDYRYDESHRHYQLYLMMRNDKKYTALDVAYELLDDFNQLSAEKQAIIERDPRINPMFIIHDLIERGAKANIYLYQIKKIKNEIKNKTWPSCATDSIHITQARQLHSREDLLRLFSTISADVQLTLKMKKRISVNCLRAYISANLTKDYSSQLYKDLSALKFDLNGSKQEKPSPQMQYIRQLRSALWIVRQIRGLLGGSSTQVEMNVLITQAKKVLRPSNSGSAKFFKSANSRHLLNESMPLKDLKLDEDKPDNSPR